VKLLCGELADVCASQSIEGNEVTRHNGTASVYWLADALV
jgi:hypothetical protein